MKHTTRAWAVKNDYTDINGKKYPGLLGVYYFDYLYQMPAYHTITTCLFKTREIARKYCNKAIRESRSLGNKFTVVSVIVTVKEVGK